MIETDAHTTSRLEAKQPNTILDLVLYLIAGIGFFVLSSSFLPLVTQVGTLPDSLLRYLLNLVFLGGTTILLGVNRQKVTWNQLGLHPGRWRIQWLWVAVGVSFVLNPVRAVIALAAQMLFGGGLEALEGRAEILTAGGFSWPIFLITLLGVGFLIPISEELYFRGLLHNWFAERFRFWPRVLLSSAIFGLGHFDSIGVVISSFIMGIANAVAYERTQSLWLPVAIHSITNSAAIILLFLSLALSN